MLFRTPDLGDAELAALAQLDELKESLRFALHEPRRWSGSLRRLSFARNIQGSNSIEGFDAALDDAAAVAMGEEPLDVTEETRQALEGYRNAMTYVLQICEDTDDVAYTEQLLKSLHFMMTGYSLHNRPGRWRSGTIYVHDESSGDIVYEGPDVDLVPSLVDELVRYLDHSDDPPVVKGAMAHLNLVMIHPFRDGNGRMARCLQSLVLAHNGVLSPVFMSIEEYLGQSTTAYYDVLARAGGGSWQPDRDARGWLRFVITAHLRQATTLRRRIRESERVWQDLVGLAGDDSRVVHALFDAAFGLRIRRATYMKIVEDLGEQISEPTASRDLKVLADAGYLTAHGEKRGRYYLAGAPIREIREKARRSLGPREDTDPFED